MLCFSQICINKKILLRFFWKKYPDKIFVFKKYSLKICAENNYALINWINFLDDQSMIGT